MADDRRVITVVLFWTVCGKIDKCAISRELRRGAHTELNAVFGGVQAVINLFRRERYIENIDRLLFTLSRRPPHPCDV